MDEQSVIGGQAHSGVVLNIRTAASFWQRLKGLLGTNSFHHNEALHILACNSVHTCFMRYPIDVVFLDKHRQVIKVVRHLGPWRVAMCLRAASTLELAAGQAQRRGLYEGVDATALLNADLSALAPESGVASPRERAKS